MGNKASVSKVSDEVTVQLRHADNRWLIEVKGKYVVLSRINTLIESYFARYEIEEVRIYAAESLSIDANLSRDRWHGRNLAVLANEIIVLNWVTWDVSGYDSFITYHSNAGTGRNGVGIDGNDGYPGESGGNVLLQAKTIQHPERLTIISNGGDGSRGQDGGNGENGANGQGISWNEFERKFPPCARQIIADRYNNAKTIMENVLLPVPHVRTEWLATSASKSNIRTSHLLSHFKQDLYQYFDAYIDVVKPDGCEVIYSTYYNWFRSQSFLLYKGSPGQQGKHGGRYGRGGQGGFPGEIMVKSLDSWHFDTFDVKTQVMWGNDGIDGTGGLQGRHGKNGWDMGWADVIHKATIYYGTDANSKLQLSFHDENAPDRIWCPYKALNSDYAYVSINPAKDNPPSSNRIWNNTRARSERQNHAKAIGKKSIPRRNIVATFSEYLEEIEEEEKELEKQRIEKEIQRMQREKEELERKRKERERIEKEKKEEQEKERQRIEKEEQELENKRIELEKEELEKQRLEKEKQEREEKELEKQWIEKETQRMQREKEELEKKRIERERIEKEKNEEQEKEKERQRIDKEEQELEKQRIELEKEELEKQRLEKEKQEKEEKELERQRIEKEQDKENQRIEEEKQELDKQRIENEKKALEKQRIENENQRLEMLRLDQMEIQKEKQLLTKQEIDHDENDVWQQVDENEQQILDITTEQTIKRYINFAQDTNDLNRCDSVQINTSVQAAEDLQLFDILKDNLNVDDWLQLQTRVVDRGELMSLVELFETIKPKFNTLLDKNQNYKIEIISATLKMKDKFTILRDIVQKLASYHATGKSFVLTAQNVARYLNETNEVNDTINHPTLGPLNQYLFQNSSTQRGNISQFVTTALKSSDNALKRAIETLILEMNSSSIENERVQQFYDEYFDYLDNQQNNIDTIRESLEEELQKSQHKEALRLWNECANDDGLLGDLETVLKQDKTLSSLYDRFKREKNSEYDWGKCAADEQIQKIFKIHLEQEGIMNKSYRVLIAFVYDVNIRVYTSDEDDEIVLLEDHDTESPRAIHILLKTNNFSPLIINQAYRQLDEERLRRDNIYRRVLSEIAALQFKYVLLPHFERQIVYPNDSDPETAQQELDEERAIEKISSFFAGEEKDLVAERLRTISSQYTNQHGVFEGILQRFSFEGLHVSFNELCFLINSILEHSIGKRQERYTFAWIISAYNQCNWTDELVLLHLENSFKRKLKEKAELRAYMSKINNKEVLLVFAAQFTRNPCSLECVRHIFYLLSNIPIQSVCLDQLELTEWPYVLKEHYWKQKLKSLMSWNNESESLKSATFFILSIENIFGAALMELLFERLQSKSDKLTHEMLTSILLSFHTQKWNLSEDDLNILKQDTLQKWIEYMKNKYKINLEELNVSQLVTIIKGNENTSANIINHLSEIQLSVSKIRSNEMKIETQSISSFNVDDIKKWASGFQNNKKEPNADVYEEMLAVIDRAIELKRGFRLRDTQRLTVLSLLTNDKSTLAQVSTGEGKTLIVVATAIIKALLREKVDIVTSSSVLAQRDADENNDIYELFGLTASHNCSENIEDRKYAYSSNQIIYGDLANFQRDYLLDRFYGKNVLGDRTFELVIVDEVDSMLLDKGNNILYLSHDIAGMDKLESVYVFIWQSVSFGNSPTDLPEDDLVEKIKQAVLSEIYPSIQIEDIQSLDSSMNKANVLILWERLVESGIISDSGRLLTKGIDPNKLDEALSPDFTHYKDRLSFLLWSRIDYEPNIKVPNFLKQFVERHLDKWISSALTALYMVPEQYYVVDVDRSGTSADRNANIIILDRDTGTDQVSSQWDEALHQFLQIKHGCKLSTQTLKAVFISNVTYFKNYELLYGLTGTLGSKRERELLKDIHQVDFVTIPTHKPKQFEEYDSIICLGTEDWKQCIRREVEKLTNIAERSVLIICETISNVEVLQKVFQAENQPNVHTYVRDYEKLTIDKDGLQQGQIIIATNLAGRGTDIKISKKLEEAGGLHVLVTYLPVNIRIEEQAFGRAARKGEKGSGRMIVKETEDTTHNRSNIITLKQKRNEDEILRISAIKSYYETTIKTEEYYFKEFKVLYEQKMKTLAHAETPDPVKEILLQSSLDKWSFWLDENNAQINNTSDEEGKRQLQLLLDQFLTQFNVLLSAIDKLLKQRQESFYKSLTTIPKPEWHAANIPIWSTWVAGSPMQMIKLGKYISQHEANNYGAAFDLFGKVIESEPHFCEAAYYYRAYTRSLENMNIKDFEKDLRMSERLFDQRKKITMHVAGVVDELKTSTPQINGYEEQKKSLINVYSLFIQSIDDILGHEITPESFINESEKYIKEDVAGQIFEDLIEIGMIKKAAVVGNIPDAQLKKLHSEYGISIDHLKIFLAQHAGPIDVKEFLRAIKKTFSFPSRIEFWESLVHQNVLHSVTKYVTVNEERLNVMDPALMNLINEKVQKGELVKEVVKVDKDQILLIHEHQSNLCFEKNQFLLIIGEKKYNSIEEKGVLSFNEKASMNKSKFADCVFSEFDSITAQDISNKTRITTIEANNIINELLKQKVLEKRGSTLVLTSNKEIIQDAFLPTYPVYENVVRDILSSYFAYRLALQNILLQLEEEPSLEIRIDLQRDPYGMFFSDLLEQKIIQTPKAMHEIDESKIKKMYSKFWSTEKLMSGLAKDIGLQTEYTKLLVEVLRKNGWIVGLIEPYTLRPKNDRSNLDVLRSGITSINANHGLVNNYDLAVAVEKWCNIQLTLQEGEIAKYIENVLNKSKSILASLKEPKGDLKSIIEVHQKTQFGNIDEMRIFITNGLEHLLELSEKKWTLEMILNTFAVACIGLIQIVIGAIMEVVSVGALTNVAGAFIGEGVSDIMFAVSAGISGYFSWSDYGKHKVESLTFTAVTLGIGTLFSLGAKVSRIGLKIAGSGLEYGGKRVSTLAGKQLIKAVGSRAVIKETAKRMAKKVVEGVSVAVTNAAADKIVSEHLQNTLKDLSSTIVSGVKEKVAKHKVNHTLQKAYNLLGEKEARDLVTGLTNVYFLKQQMTDTFLPFAKNMMESVTKGIINANKKTGGFNGALMLVNQIGKVLKFTETVKEINQIISATEYLLDYVNTKIEQELADKKHPLESSEDKQERRTDFERFREEVIEKWETTLIDHVKQLIEQHIAVPLLRMGINSTASYVGKSLKTIRRSMIESKASKNVQRIKTRHEQKIKQPNMTDDTKRHLTDQYHDQLLNNLKKTRNPALFAKIIRENVPMDLTCVGACTPMVHKMLQAQNPAITGLTITVHGEKGIKQSFSSGTGGPEIHLRLVNNHFTVSEVGKSAVNTSDNNCLYGALATAIPALQSVDQKTFRVMLSNFIQTNKSMHYHIRQLWHRAPLQHGAVGGATHTKSVYVDDESSADEQGNSFKTVKRTPSYHLVARLKHTFRFGGELREACDTTQNVVENIIKNGASNYKANRKFEISNHKQEQETNKQTVKKIKLEPIIERHQSHVVRIKLLNKIQTTHPETHRRLALHTGHTQYVDKWYNVFHRIGGDIDRNQANWFMRLAKLDFGENYKKTPANTIQEIRAILREYINVLKKYESEKGGDEVKKAISSINKLTTEDFYNYWKRGYGKTYQYKAKNKNDEGSSKDSINEE